MKALIDSLKRLYFKNLLSRDELRLRVAKNTMTAAEYKSITGEEYQEKSI